MPVRVSCSEVIAYYWQMNQERIGQYDGFAETFLIDGKVPQKAMFLKPGLAVTHEKIATGGRDAFIRAISHALSMLKSKAAFCHGDLSSHTRVGRARFC